VVELTLPGLKQLSLIDLKRLLDRRVRETRG
jgi:hypothetical protein